MRWSEQITLIALSEPTEATNEHGFPIPKPETATTVFADMKSVGYSEYFEASKAGYTAALKFDVHSFEYSGQQIVEFPVASGKRYRVLRTYLHTGSKYRQGNGEFTELTLVDLPEAQEAPEEEGGEEDGES
jgi:hypothetical protein